MNVPYVALPLRVSRVRNEIMSAIERVVDSGAWILGPDVAAFERAIAAYCGARFAVGVSDGTMALVLTLRGLGVGPGDEIITAPNSFVASASSAALIGATPRFVDVTRAEMNLDPDLLEAAIGPKTKAIVPVHLAGHAADMDRILAIAERHGIPVVEDAAQAIGSRYRGRRVGGLARAGCFSLHPLKNLHAIGDAGVITTNDEVLYEWLLKARNHGLRTRDEVEFWSTNSRLDTMQAAILNVMLGQLDGWLEERRAIAREYCERLADVVEVPHERDSFYDTFQTFVIRAENREGLLAHLKECGVEAKIHYPIAIPGQAAARSLGHRPGDFPEAEWLSSRIVSLPLYGELTSAQKNLVVDAVRSFYR